MSLIPEIYGEIKTMIQHRKKGSAWQKKYEPHVPKVGEMATDFTLQDTTASHTVTLADFQGIKPVALVLGSFTWPPYVNGTVSLSEMYKQYHDQVQFLSIYIREAHPIDGWWLGFRLTRKIVERRFPKAAMDVYDPQTIEERRVVAGQCEQALQYGIRTYVDEMDDRVSKAYAAKPTRLFLPGQDGRVVYRGGLGPFGFKPAELKAAIEDYLSAQSEMPTS